MNTIKITSGKLRGRALNTPGGETHPMGSREKLALFNMIAGFLPDTYVLDAYAGSGALGIEALSRGAKEAVFIEKNRAACRVIQGNLVSLGLKDTVFCGTVENFCATGERFDIIIADPPYDDFDLEEVKMLPTLLNPEGTLVLSHPGEAPEIPEMELFKSHQYAAAHISLYKH